MAKKRAAKIRPVPVPRPSRSAYKYYNTMIFHGYFRSAITLLSLATGVWLLFVPHYEAITRQSALLIHLVAGFFGVYLLTFHVVGYFACPAVHADHLAEPRKQLTDTGWVMVGLAVGSVTTGVVLWQGWVTDPNMFRFFILLHVAAALSYVALSVTHLHYYWNRWRPALKTGKRGLAQK